MHLECPYDATAIKVGDTRTIQRLIQSYPLNAISDAASYCVSPTSKQQVQGVFISREKKIFEILTTKVGGAFIMRACPLHK